MDADESASDGPDISNKLFRRYGRLPYDSSVASERICRVGARDLGDQDLTGLSIFYFAAIVTVERAGIPRKALFLLHLALTVVIGLLSGSRSLVLMNFFWMILIWNNLRRPLTAKGILTVGVALVSAGFILGTARDVVSYSGISQGDFGSTNIEEMLSSDRIAARKFRNGQ